MSILQRHCYTRRDVMRTGASLGALAVLPGCLRPWWGETPNAPPFAVDIHCHIFNAKDLPVAGFLLKWFRTNLAQLIRRGIPSDAVAEAIAETALLPLLPVLVALQAGLQLVAPGADEDLGAPPVSERPYTSQELAEMLRPEVNRVARAELARIATDSKANARTRRVAPLAVEPDATSLADVLTTLRVEPLSGFSKLLETIEQDASAAAPLGISILPMPRPGEEAAVATRAYDALLLKWISDRLNFFLVGTHSRRSIGREVARTYPEVELLAPALVDFDEWIDVQPALGLTRAPVTPAAQVLLLERLSRLSMEGRLIGTPAGKQRLHGYAAYCPAREISLAETAYPKVPAAQSRWAGSDTAYHEETEPNWRLAASRPGARRAAAEALLGMAQEERRAFTLLCFSGAVTYDATVQPGEALPQEALFVGCAGGTDIAAALGRGLDIIQAGDAGMKAADVVLITDGISTADEAPALRERAKALGATVLGFGIGVAPEKLAPWCDQAQAISSVEMLESAAAESLAGT